MSTERHSVGQYIKNEYVDVCRKNITGAVAAHWHDFYELELILEGSGTYTIDDIDYPIQKGSMFIMSPASFHRPVFTSETKLINFMFTLDACDMDFLYDIFRNDPHIALQIEDSHMPFFSTLTQEMIAFSEKDADALNRKYVYYLLNTILSKISILCYSGPVQKIDSSLQHAILYIQNNFTGNISLEEVAKVANYSPNYFSDKFKKYTGLTFRQYVIDLRLSLAESLLRRTQLPIAQIVYKCGFRDHSNFMSTFRKRYGVTPNTFRKDRNQAHFEN